MIRSAYFAAIADFCKQTFATQNFLMSQIFANIAILSKRKCGRVVECTGLENRRRLTPFVSSNLTASATMHNRTIRNRSFLFPIAAFPLIGKHSKRSDHPESSATMRLLSALG